MKKYKFTPSRLRRLYQIQRGLSRRKREARELRQRRRTRIFLLSLQTLTVEKLEKMFDKVVRGEIELIGMLEAPWQTVEPPKFIKIWELKKKLLKKQKRRPKPFDFDKFVVDDEDEGQKYSENNEREVIVLG